MTWNRNGTLLLLEQAKKESEKGEKKDEFTAFAIFRRTFFREKIFITSGWYFVNPARQINMKRPRLLLFAFSACQKKLWFNVKAG